MPGRLPKPKAMKKLQGTRLAINAQGVDYTPLFELPEAPPHLLEDGRKLWDEFGRELAAAGVLQSLDVFPLALLAGLWDRHMSAMRGGDEITAADSTALRTLFAEFGATPSSRRRVTPNVSKQIINPFTKFRSTNAA